MIFSTNKNTICPPSKGRIGKELNTAIKALIEANKPTFTRTNNSIETEYTYSLDSQYRGNDASYPLIVLNKSQISITLLNLDGSGEDYAIEVQLDFWALQKKHGSKAIDSAQDELAATFLANKDNFESDNKLLLAEDFWDDSNTTPFEEGNQLLHTGSSIIKFILQ